MRTIISNQGMKPDLEKVAAITRKPTPKNIAALLRVIGMVNYIFPLLSQPERGNTTTENAHPGICTFHMV